VPGQDGVTAAAHVPYGSGAAAQRARHGQHGRARVALGAGHDADHPAAVLVALAAGAGQQRGDVGVLERFQLGRAEVGGQADVDQPGHADEGGGGVDQQAGLVRAEGDGHVGVHGVAGELAGVGVHAAGEVDGDHRGAGVPGRGGQRDGVRAEAAFAADADDAVEDEVGAGEEGGALLRGGGAAAGRAEVGEGGGVRAVGVEQHGGRGGAAAGEAGGGVEGVAAVVAASGEDDDAGAVEALAVAAEHVGAHGREARGCPAHQRAVRAAGDERGFGRSHDVDPVRNPHPRLLPPHPNPERTPVPPAHARRTFPRTPGGSLRALPQPSAGGTPQARGAVPRAPDGPPLQRRARTERF
jgi:hypothetical protein